jgi:AcrR family transcriptional regulator
MPRPSRWEDVVAASAKVFREKGYAGASLGDIAEELGMHKGSIYNYIDSKDELLLAVVRPPAEALLSRMRELMEVDLPASEKVRRVSRIHAGILEEFHPYAAVYVQEIAGRHPEGGWVEMDHEYIHLFKQILADGVADGEFDPSLNANVAVLSLVGALNWMTRWWHPDGKRSATEIADEIASLFLAGALVRHVIAPKRLATASVTRGSEKSRRANARRTVQS